MAELTNVHGVATSVVVAFLEKVWQFNRFGKESLEQLARGAVLAFYPKNAVLLRQDLEQPEYVYLIERGAVRLYRKETDETTTLADYRGEGSLFGVASIVRGLKASLTIEAAEDTFCFLLDKGQFLEFVANNPSFVENYFRGLSEDLVCRTYSQLRSSGVGDLQDEGLRLVNARVGDAVRRPPECVDPGELIHKAAERMTRGDVSVLLVRDSTQGIVGMLSDRDLRTVVARRGDYHQPVSSIMTSPAVSISSHNSCLDAILRMMNQDVQHLVITKGDDAIGVVSAQDILALQEASPLVLLREIDNQTTIEGLYESGNQVTRLVQNLVSVGAKANNITRIISVLNDHVVGRLLALLQERLGPSPLPFCWIVMGSEGRMEQTLRTDQDNGILYEDPGKEWERTKAAKLYFRALGNEIIEHLVKCGYPLCKGGYMASKSRWRKPFSVWAGYFDEWMSGTDEFTMLNVKIFLDLRSGFGSEALADKLRDYFFQQTRRRRFFINNLCRDSLVIKPPLSFFRNFIVESDGEHKNQLDLKMRGLVPVVDFARALALKYEIRETNTIARLQSLKERRHLPEDLCSEILDAYDFIMHLRLVHQLRMSRQGLEPHNFVDPADLTDLEKQTLRGAFGAISRMQTHMAKIRAEF
ncbi:MAG TPA: DUF294 nucleotidyltransferase-like domain-containing protein [Desulfomonilaceae bacterium]|nr:DUF294 nucleotidyltransferase-like domain-containing protein [Desulfomonilaceae bacterium]